MTWHREAGITDFHEINDCIVASTCMGSHLSVWWRKKYQRKSATELELKLNAIVWLGWSWFYDPFAAVEVSLYNRNVASNFAKAQGSKLTSL